MFCGSGTPSDWVHADTWEESIFRISIHINPDVVFNKTVGDEFSVERTLYK